MNDEPKKPVRCSFCGKRESEVRRMLQGPGARICDQCVNLCMSVLDEELGGYVCDVIVPAGLRGRGYGYQGLALLCQAGVPTPLVILIPLVMGLAIGAFNGVLVAKLKFDYCIWQRTGTSQNLFRKPIKKISNYRKHQY